jgi:hypothetical protein
MRASFRTTAKASPKCGQPEAEVPHRPQPEGDEEKLNLRGREANQVGAHHRRDRTGSADLGNDAAGLARSLHERGHKASAEVQQREQRPSEHVLDERSAEEEVQQVADQMHQPRVHEHRGQRREDARVRGHVSQPEHRLIAACLLGGRHQRVQLALLLAHSERRRSGAVVATSLLEVGHALRAEDLHHGRRRLQIGIRGVMIERRLPPLARRFFRVSFGRAHPDEHQDVQREDDVTDPGVTPDLRVIACNRNEHSLASDLGNDTGR